MSAIQYSEMTMIHVIVPKNYTNTKANMCNKLMSTHQHLLFINATHLQDVKKQSVKTDLRANCVWESCCGASRDISND